MTTSPDHKAELLRKLEQAGQGGVTKSKLFGTKARKEKEEALAGLLASRKVANLGAEKKQRFVLGKFYNPLELAYEAIEAKATPGKATTYLEKDLAKGCAGAVVQKVPEAIHLLLGEKKLIRIQRGKSVFYLHAASIQPLVNFSIAAETVSPQPQRTEVPVEQLHAAYRELVRESGFSDVRIFDLHKRSGVPLETLKPWLIEQSRAGKVLPTRGDWSLSDDEAREAAIEIGGEPHLRVRLL